MKTLKFGFMIVSTLLLLFSLTACSTNPPIDDSESQSDTQTDNLNSTLPVLHPAGTTLYVRPDGGTAEQCSGMADAPYPGSGTDQGCAWNHPFQALPPGGTPRILGGDTLIIGAGSYMLGYGAPGAENCEYEGSYDCSMPPIPSGPDAAHPTRILGEGWDKGCLVPPELWGSGRPFHMIDMTGSSNVEIACMEITDHSSCIEDHLFTTGGSPYTCQRDTPPYGDWAAVGLYAEDSANVLIEGPQYPRVGKYCHPGWTPHGLDGRKRAFGWQRPGGMEL